MSIETEHFQNTHFARFSDKQNSQKRTVFKYGILYIVHYSGFFCSDTAFNNIASFSVRELCIICHTCFLSYFLHIRPRPLFIHCTFHATKNIVSGCLTAQSLEKWHFLARIGSDFKTILMP